MDYHPRNKLVITYQMSSEHLPIEITMAHTTPTPTNLLIWVQQYKKVVTSRINTQHAQPNPKFKMFSGLYCDYGHLDVVFRLCSL